MQIPKTGMLMIIKEMLTKAVDKGLQVILLTCDPKPYESFADHNVILTKYGDI